MSSFVVFVKGTWQFLSIKNLGFTFRPHDITDEFESFYWTILYVTLRYLHWTGETTPDEALAAIFYPSKDWPYTFGANSEFRLHIQIGGSGKTPLTLCKHILDKHDVKNNPGLTQWITTRFKDLEALCSWNLEEETALLSGHEPKIWKALQL